MTSGLGKGQLKREGERERKRERERRGWKGERYFKVLKVT